MTKKVWMDLVYRAREFARAGGIAAGISAAMAEARTRWTNKGQEVQLILALERAIAEMPAAPCKHGPIPDIPKPLELGAKLKSRRVRIPRRVVMPLPSARVVTEGRGGVPSAQVQARAMRVVARSARTPEPRPVAATIVHRAMLPDLVRLTAKFSAHRAG